MLDLVDVVTDPDFASAFNIIRLPPASFQDEGAWVRATGPNVVVPVFGAVMPSDQDDIVQFLPEGERAKRCITIFSPVAIYMSDGQGRESDLVTWNGDTYRVAFCEPWETLGGYWFVMAVFVPKGVLPV